MTRSLSFGAVFVALALGLTALLLVRPAAAATATTAQAEQFVQLNVQKGLNILSDQSLSETDRRQQFRAFLLRLADIRRTALFTLGAARRTASPAEIDAFVDAFKNYAIAVYESRLSSYSGQTLTVTGSLQRAPGDFIVKTQLTDPNASANAQPIEVDFRMVPDNGGFKVIDVAVVGVWLAIEEQAQFSSYLQQNNSVAALTKHLNEMAQQIRNNPQGAQQGN